MSGKKEAVSRIPERQESLRVPFVSQIPDPEAEVGAVKIRTRVLTNIGSRIHFITGKMEERIDRLIGYIEANKLDPENYEFDISAEIIRRDVFVPFTKKDVGNKAIILTHEELERYGEIEFVLSDGLIRKYDSRDVSEDNILIIYPWELGD